MLGPNVYYTQLDVSNFNSLLLLKCEADNPLTTSWCAPCVCIVQKNIIAFSVFGPI